jgi:hypothetical protein
MKNRLAGDNAPLTRTPRQPKDGITRRRFLTRAAAAAGYLVANRAGANSSALPAIPARQLLGAGLEGTRQERGLAPRSGAPLSAGHLDSRPKVVHVHSSGATSWDYASGWYGDFVSQAEVDLMVDRGLMELTGTASRTAAWQALIPGYLTGQRIAIKVNLNNAGSTGDSDNQADALIEPVNSVVRGLVELGADESDIWVYDAIRTIPDRLTDGCDFSGVQFTGRDVNPQGFSDTEVVSFDEPAGAPSLDDQRISQVLVDARYLINMPIMKKHGHACVTLAFKNHFGTIDRCWELHDLTWPYRTPYVPEYSPMVDIYRNAHIVGKTVVTIADGLYGSRGDQASTPAPWVTFGGKAPNSMLFSLDPVAIDCVMYDYLEAEAGVTSGGDDYLLYAAQEGLGVFEHRAPGASDPADWYSFIDYVYVDLIREHRVFVPCAQR